MKYLIMHGSYGSPDENWFRWLEKELKSLGHQVILEQFPVDSWDDIEKIGADKIGSYQAVESLSSWEMYFVDHILPQIKDEEVGFVGHSIAPIFILHMLNKYDFKLKKAIFVSPFFNIPDAPAVWQFYPVNKTFYSYDFNFDKIKSQIGKSYVVYGDNDPYVPATEPPLFAEKLGSELHVVPGGGHCGGIFKEFPLLLDIVNKEK
jgi:predicted alpha/beta hydrolase family esterase